MKSEKVKEKEKARVKFLYRTKWLPTYLMFIALYPFHLEDLEGEIWRWIAGFEGLYQISNYGRVKSFVAKYGNKTIKYKQGVMILKPHLTRNGYLNVSLSKNDKNKSKSKSKLRGQYFPIHRLVAQAFIPNPQNKATVNHKYGMKFDCYFENLEWATQSENNKHAVNTGLSKSGADCKFAKLTKEDVKFIRENYKPLDPEFGGAALARRFHVSPSCIDLIIHGKTYKNID